MSDIKTYFGISMKVMNKADMFANKLIAMTERLHKTSRDVFDVWFFLQNSFPINTDIITKRTNLSFENFLQNCINSLETYDNKSILSGIGELLDEKQKAWAKANLKSDTIFFLKVMLDDEKRMRKWSRK